MEPSEPMKKMVANAFPFASRTGVELVELDRGHVKMRMPLEGNHNHVKSMYAGALFTLAELPGGAMCLSSFDMKRFYPIVKSMKIDFKRPVRTDATVITKLDEEVIAATMAQAEEVGKADWEMTAEIFDDAGELCAITTGVYQLRRIGR